MKVFCAVTTVLLMCLGLPARAELEDGISAIVNDKVITINEVRDSAAQAVDVLQREYADQPDVFDQKLNATLNDSLETLIENQLILHEFQTKYNPLPDSLVDEWIEDRIKEQFGDRVTCIRTLQAQGITFEKFRQQVRDKTIIEQLRLQKLSEDKIIISPYKIETYYKLHQDEFKVGDEVQLRMIVLNKISPDDATARQRANEIIADLKKGSSFQQLASLYSQDPEQKGNDWMETSVLRKELADAVTTLRPGDTSGVIETSDECYILQLEDRRTAHVKPLKDVRSNIETTLRALAQKDEERRWIDSLKKKAFIRYFAGPSAG
jgi:peptidyl-prolyl cis-trans isomerase SurA